MASVRVKEQYTLGNTPHSVIHKVSEQSDFQKQIQEKKDAYAAVLDINLGKKIQKPSG